ncbi:MAG: bifunctional riboflavin kinase/FAD synthetase, partial [Nitrospirales bacterium]
RPAQHPVLTIGNFDGQHRGHQALLQGVRDKAASVQGWPMVLTFDPHPVRVLAPHVDFRQLSSMDEKLARFREAGIQEVLMLEFTQAFASLTPEAFVGRVLRDGVQVRELFVGEHFIFGKDRVGNARDLVRLGRDAGFTVHLVSPVRVDGQVVSSTRIRGMIQKGEVRKAAEFLGRRYALGGRVIRGAQRGTDLGWPTANLRLPAGRVIPADGVYATTVRWKACDFPSVSYIGTRPTFGSGERLLEAYLLDVQEDLYDEEISVQFVERVRDDQVFNTPGELAARIELDVSQARAALEGWAS